MTGAEVHEPDGGEEITRREYLYDENKLRVFDFACAMPGCGFSRDELRFDDRVDCNRANDDLNELLRRLRSDDFAQDEGLNVEIDDAGVYYLTARDVEGRPVRQVAILIEEKEGDWSAEKLSVSDMYWSTLSGGRWACLVVVTDLNHNITGEVLYVGGFEPEDMVWSKRVAEEVYGVDWRLRGGEAEATYMMLTAKDDKERDEWSQVRRDYVSGEREYLLGSVEARGEGANGFQYKVEMDHDLGVAKVWRYGKDADGRLKMGIEMFYQDESGWATRVEDLIPQENGEDFGSNRALGMKLELGVYVWFEEEGGYGEVMLLDESGEIYEPVPIQDDQTDETLAYYSEDDGCETYRVDLNSQDEWGYDTAVLVLKNEDIMVWKKIKSAVS